MFSKSKDVHKHIGGTDVKLIENENEIKLLKF